MPGFLLDVNVLIAMAWPTHTSHASVHRWFGKHAHQGWATCPITECAFVRITSNPAFSPNALTPQQALTLLGVNLAHPAHHFWRDDLNLHRALASMQGKITGHQQIMDAYLLGLAHHHKAKLATLDQAVKVLLGTSESDLELIPVS